eukprot:1759288-Pyramimonas_sp.AAC.1
MIASHLRASQGVRRDDCVTQVRGMKGLKVQENARPDNIKGAPSAAASAPLRCATPAFGTFVPLTYCTTHLEDASGIIHFVVSVLRLTRLTTLDRYFFSDAAAGAVGIQALS